MAKTYNVGRLSIEMVADTVQYVQKLKAAEKVTADANKKLREELAKTTSASKKGARETEKYSDKLSKLGQAAALVNGPMGGVASRIGALNSMMGGAGGVIVGVGSLAVGFGALVSSVAATGIELNEQQKELRVYAELAGITTREMMLMSAATKTVGVSQEKFGDIIKDTRDKLGDFVTTGAGPFVDVFDVLGGHIKYTAQELQAMSGTGALEAIAHAMEAANIPMGEQIFLMESIASDSSKLLTLYADQSDELQRLQYETDLVTRSIDGQLQAYADLGKQTGYLKQNFADLATEAMEPLIGYIANAAKEWNILLASMDKTSEAHRLLKMDELAEEIHGVQTAIGNATGAMGRFRNVLSFQSNDVTVLYKQLTKLNAEYDKLLQQGVDEAMPKPKKTNPNEFQNVNAVGNQGPNIPAMEKTYRDYESKVAEQNKKAADKKAKADIAAQNRAKAQAKKLLDIEKKKNKAMYDENQRAADAMMQLREMHRQMEADAFALQTMALSSPVTNVGEDQTLEQAQMDQEMELLKLNHDRELELLRQQYAHKTELENEYQAAMKASKAQYAAESFAIQKAAIDAESALYMGIAQGIGNHISALAGATDEEKEQLQKQFLLKQAMAAGQASIDYFSTISAHEATAASLGLGGPAYLAAQVPLATASWQKNLAGIAAVTLGGAVAGQFHSGTDEVPNEGSYLLQKGERVVQPKANKDLTSFLNGGNGGGGGTGGNVTIEQVNNITASDDKAIMAAIAKQPDQIAALVRKSDSKFGRGKR